MVCRLGSLSVVTPDRPAKFERHVRAMCFNCFKSKQFCLCEEWRTHGQVHNLTAITIIQHPRERHHALGTVRIARLGLANVEVACIGPKESCADERTQALLERLPTRAALLYPGPQSVSLEGLASEELPEHLVVLDGTWHHTKTLLRDLRSLHALPRVHIQPKVPSQYRIRREPTAESLSTIEAITEALEVIEPSTPGLARLREAFVSMIDRQIAASATNPSPRFTKRAHPWRIGSKDLAQTPSAHARIERG